MEWALVTCCGDCLCVVSAFAYGEVKASTSPFVHAREGSGAGVPAFKPSSCSRSAKPPPIAS